MDLRFLKSLPSVWTSVMGICFSLLLHGIPYGPSAWSKDGLKDFLVSPIHAMSINWWIFLLMLCQKHNYIRTAPMSVTWWRFAHSDASRSPFKSQIGRTTRLFITSRRLAWQLNNQNAAVAICTTIGPHQDWMDIINHSNITTNIKAIHDRWSLRTSRRLIVWHNLPPSVALTLGFYHSIV